jgi:hypothetical protein
MRIRAWEALCALFLGAVMANGICTRFTSTALAQAQTAAASPWVGVWQAQLDGLPSAVLTLAQDNGTLEGTLVLSIISRDTGTPHVIAHEPHVLMNLQVNAATLSFQLKRIDGSSAPMNFNVEQTTDGKARMHCLNCGDDAPTVEIAKLD